MAITGNIQRGSIVYIELSPQAGYEQGGRRPALVVSDGIVNPGTLAQKFAAIVPLANTKREYPYHVPVPENEIEINHPEEGVVFLTGQALCEQVKALDMNQRNADVVGQVDITSEFYKKVIAIVRSIFF
ncbi:type II toxin-antitoxin system PemK/MazF family toxin [Paenibacillus nanensis]|uniref:Type II toxin-antitoxin system PemK/MazF family toxin n=1 Tax=Paenibacillus nanensis TaxID=393251 RepID=A0A3A1UMM7_9BACL|nr:type II toxin-antitoxin system PemK/MazF family toxin [Paenibacillus nanensis]RIX48660.1 type II toxin-antitoxin system PemK/MazF family toxin [Paenibacillus nanensis]